MAGKIIEQIDFEEAIYFILVRLYQQEKNEYKMKSETFEAWLEEYKLLKK